jgi:PPOX class probable F420-dependent enzyme
MATPLDSIRELIESGPLAHLVTLNLDGSPQVTIVWIGIEDDELVSGHLFRHQKVRNIQRNPRVVLSLEGPGTDAAGLRNYAVVDGTARIIEGGAPELLQRLAYTYIGPGVTFPPMPDPPPGYVTRIRVDRVTGHGPWAADSSRT